MTSDGEQIVKKISELFVVIENVACYTERHNRERNKKSKYTSA